MTMLMDPLAILLGISMGIDIGIDMGIGIDIFMFIGVVVLTGVVVFTGVVMFIVMPTFSARADPPNARTNNIDISINPAGTKLLIFILPYGSC